MNELYNNYYIYNDIFIFEKTSPYYCKIYRPLNSMNKNVYMSIDVSDLDLLIYYLNDTNMNSLFMDYIISKVILNRV